MRRVFAYGFEGGDLYGNNLFGSVSPNIQSTVKRTGSYAGECNAGSAQSCYMQVNCNMVSTTGAEFYHIAAYFVALPTSNKVIMRLNAATGSSTNLDVILKTDGKLAIGFAGVVSATALSVQPTGSWIEIELGVDRVSGYASLRVNEQTELDWTSVAGMSTSTAAAFYIGSLETTLGAFHWYFDDMTGDAEEWVGHEKVKRLDIASLDTDNANWTLASGSTKLGAITEVTADDDTTYLLGPANTTDEITFAFGSIPSDMVGIRGVFGVARVRRNGASNGGIIPSYIYLGFVSALNTISTNSATYFYSFDTGASASCSPIHPCWDRDVLAALKVKFRSSSANQSRLSQFYTEVAYSDRAGSDRDIPRHEVMATFFNGNTDELDWTGTSVSTGTNAVAAHPLGGFGLRVSPAALANGSHGWVLYNDYWTNSNRKTVFAKFDFYAHVIPSGVLGSAYAEIFYISTSAGVIQCSVRLNTNGSLSFWNAVDGELTPRSPATTIALDTEYNIQIEIRAASSSSTTDGFMKLYVNGALVLSWLNIRPKADMNSLTWARMGTNSNNHGSVDFYYRNVISDWCSLPARDLKCAYLLASGAGSVAGSWTAVGDTNVYQTIDDPSGAADDGDTTYAKSPTVNNDVTSLALGNLPAAAQTVIQVMLLWKGKRDAATSVNAQVEVRPDNGNSRGIRILQSLGASYTSTAAMLPTSRGRGRWTVPIVNASEIGLVSNSATNQGRITRVVVVVSYTTRVQSLGIARSSCEMQG